MINMVIKMPGRCITKTTYQAPGRNATKQDMVSDFDEINEQDTYKERTKVGS